MQKLCFAVKLCIRISNRIPCVKVSSNEANGRNTVFLTLSGYQVAYARSKKKKMKMKMKNE